jgi:hypothetical protein
MEDGDGRGTLNGVVVPYGRGLQPSGHAGGATIAIASHPLATGFIPGIPNDAPALSPRRSAAEIAVYSPKRPSPIAERAIASRRIANRPV